MAAVPPGFADISVQLSLTGMARPAFITFGVDPVDTNPNNVADSVHLAASYAGSVISRFDQSVTWGPITARLGQDGGEALVGTTVVTLVGGQSLQSPPPNCAVLVHKRSARGGRRGRGRMFMPWFVNEGSIDEAGVIISSDITAMNAALAIFLTQLSSNAVPMVILHDEGISAMGAPNLVTSLTADRLIATQRRRLGR